MKHRLRKEGRIDNIGRGGARESVSTSSSTKRDAGLGVEVTRTDRELHECDIL